MVHPQLRTRRSAILLLIGVVGILIAACSAPKGPAAKHERFNPLASTTTSTVDRNALRLPEGFQLPDTRFVSLVPVTGKPQPVPPIPVRGGAAIVEGTVTGPGGAVGGASVRIERWVGDASGAIMATTDGAGHFAVGGLLGGHYKVRAWLQPSLATFDAATGFVPWNGTLRVDVAVEQHDAFTVQLAATSATATVGTGFGLVALVTKEQVNGDGIVVDAPVAGVPARLRTDQSIKVDGGNPVKTGAAGTAVWTLTCRTAGSFGADVSTPHGDVSTSLPPCTGGTTTTTEPVVIDLPVGSAFSTPAAGPYPAGTYSTDSPSCAVSFQEYLDGKWRDEHTVGVTLVLDGPGQGFQPDPGTPDCTYTRVS